MGSRWLLLFLIGTSLAAAEPDLAALIAKIESTASSGEGMNAAEQTLAHHIAEHKTAAADQLIPLLKSENEDVRQLAGYCVLELPPGSLLERHLPELIEACRKDRGWLPNAIADIDADAAVEFLAADFRRKPETGAQIDHALIQAAPRSVPHVLKEFGQATEEEEDFLDGISKLWFAMGDKAADAVKPLLEMTLDESLPQFRRERAIGYLGDIGPAAKTSFPSLKEAAVNQPEWFGTAVNAALSKSRTSEAASGLLLNAVAEARKEGEIYVFGSLAELGKEAEAVGDELAGLLDDRDTNVRLGACSALAATGRLDLWPQLARALKDPDWRVSYCACIGLAEWKAKGALPSLEQVKKGHWYPRVAHAADYAMVVINGGSASKEQMEWLGSFPEDHPLTVGSYCPKLTYLASEEVEKLGIEEPEEIRWNVEPTEEQDIPTFKGLYPAEFKAISEVIENQKRETWDFCCRLRRRLERDRGTLLGFTAGEWVGGLFTVTADGKAELILDENIENLLEWNGRYVVLSGMSHMGINEGMVHEVMNEQGKWGVRPLYALPGCPSDSGVLEDGRLFVNTQGGGVIIGKDGKFEFAGSYKSSSSE
ncbi:HEAT repeat domain-containing protein [Luteolibacter soli]|uniref:HEAT repeat domain-containing protein n=1 Tax=Luteolibacter soli TaxID=3135280 RepID=A0ABU9AW29_9BACT